MRLSEPLRAAIEEEIADIDRAAVSRAALEVSRRYRAGDFGGAMTPSERAAYLLTRLPATYASNVVVFRELTARVEAENRSLLDLGSGPGTTMWAAADVFPGIERFTAVERDAQLIAAGRHLARRSPHAGLQAASWVHDNLDGLSQVARHDLVVMSYSLGELRDPMSVVSSAWKLANVALVLIEPGTPRAFLTVIRAREMLIGLGATIAAPCPHHSQCPLAARNDWCHFSVRLERTAEHRRLKSGDLGYEDEKFSYLIATKTAAQQAETRIVRHPLKHPGHVKLTLCTPNDLQQRTVTKSEKPLYRAARKAEWGDEWSESSSPETESNKRA